MQPPGRVFLPQASTGACFLGVFHAQWPGAKCGLGCVSCPAGKHTCCLGPLPPWDQRGNTRLASQWAGPLQAFLSSPPPWACDPQPSPLPTSRLKGSPEPSWLGRFWRKPRRVWIPSCPSSSSPRLDFNYRQSTIFTALGTAGANSAPFQVVLTPPEPLSLCPNGKPHHFGVL